VEAVEGGTGALKDQEAVNARLDGDALAASCDNLDSALVGTVAEERVRVGLAVDGHATPAVDGDLDMCDVNVAVSVDEVLTEDSSEELRRVDRVLFGKYVDSLLLGIGCDYGRVVCLCVGLLDVTLKKSADSHLRDMLNSILLTTDLEQANIVLTVACIAEL